VNDEWLIARRYFREQAMQVIQTVGHSDSGKLLRLIVPVSEANRDYRVVITLQPELDQPTKTSAVSAEKEPPVPRMEGGHLVTGRGWPVGFFENVIGALKDDPIERGPQGEYEVRESLD
jgi:hypothetical protein